MLPSPSKPGSTLAMSVLLGGHVGCQPAGRKLTGRTGLTSPRRSAGRTSRLRQSGRAGPRRSCATRQSPSPLVGSIRFGARRATDGPVLRRRRSSSARAFGSTGNGLSVTPASARTPHAAHAAFAALANLRKIAPSSVATAANARCHTATRSRNSLMSTESSRRTSEIGMRAGDPAIPGSPLKSIRTVTSSGTSTSGPSCMNSLPARSAIPLIFTMRSRSVEVKAIVGR